MHSAQCQISVKAKCKYPRQYIQQQIKTTSSSHINSPNFNMLGQGVKEAPV